MKPILEVKNISKKFWIQQSNSYQSLRDNLTNVFKGSSPREEFWALKDISFDVMPGDSIGIIGKNGAGKSTLLKILSKITPPTSGKIICRGRIASLLEVGTGFHPELSGRENIFLNGSILGLKRQEISKQFDAIVDFSGVEKFIDTPLKHYSSGMQLRLAFAVAAHLEPEILIIDEVLAVGDTEFQKKCMGKMGEVSNSGRTILFVSHDLNALTNLCKTSLLLKEGAVKFQGDIMKAISQYQSKEFSSSDFVAGSHTAKKPAYFKSIRVINEGGQKVSAFLHTEPIVLEFSIGINDKLKCDLFVLILDSKKRRVCALEANDIHEKMSVTIAPNFLVRGEYTIHTFINQPNIARIDEVEDVCSFEIIDNGSQMLKHGAYDYGQVFGKGNWKIG